jgi:hypothetical protein
VPPPSPMAATILNQCQATKLPTSATYKNKSKSGAGLVSNATLRTIVQGTRWILLLCHINKREEKRRKSPLLWCFLLIDFVLS